MIVSAVKHSYTISCPSAFRDQVEALAARRKVNAGDLARSVLLVLPAEAIEAYPDPGEPDPEDRETVVLKSGPARGRPWRRKPRLQVRMPPGHDAAFIRKALAMALAMEKGKLQVQVAQAGYGAPITMEQAEEIQRMRAVISCLAFEPLANGVNTRAEALHVLGLPPGSNPDLRELRNRFRMLAAIHHPDSDFGNHARMIQINAAVDVLRRSG